MIFFYHPINGPNLGKASATEMTSLSPRPLMVITIFCDDFIFLAMFIAWKMAWDVSNAGSIPVNNICEKKRWMNEWMMNWCTFGLRKSS